MKPFFLNVLAVGSVAVLLPSAVFACFSSLSLGSYPLGEWSNGDGTWTISDTVGDGDDRATSKEELLADRDQHVVSCETKGKNLISKAENYFQTRINGLAAEFDASCTAGPFCPVFRTLWVEQETSAINAHVANMRTWYQDRIESCKSHFNTQYGQLVGYLCS